MNKKRGFTLIELLVVIAIIVILSTLAMTSYRTANVRARDARRLADMEQVRSALELYRSDEAAYPNSGATVNCTSTPSVASFNAMIALLGTDYWASGVAPTDPQNEGSMVYTYCYTTGGTGYSLVYWSESLGSTVTLHNP